MFERLGLQPDDPILHLMLEASRDTNPDKVDLTAGVYKDESGRTPIMRAVHLAEQRCLEREGTKTYLGVVGDPRFNALVTDLALGEHHSAVADQRTVTLQTTGGSGALRIAAELLVRISPGKRIWVSDPTWGNHIPLLGDAGLEIKAYPYYRPGEKGIDFDLMCECLEGQTGPGEVVLIHGGCHNPTGADLSLDQWQQLTDLVLRKDLLPFVDVAYHGLAAGLEVDSLGYRKMAESVPEMLITYSGSKNFSLYRERAGALISIARCPKQAQITLSNMKSISRVLYSMPPAHGAWLIAEVLADTELRAMWLEELGQMRERVFDMRRRFTDALAAHTRSNRFDFIRDQNGLFSFLGISTEQVDTLRRDHSIYLLGSSRISLAGLAANNLDRVARAVAAVL